MELFTLSNGLKIPCMAFGTYNADKDADEEKNLKIIQNAIQAGYRYFDTASLYGTEKVLGRAIKESGINREEFFLVSKLWIDERGYENAKKAFEDSTRRLQTDYLDLYLIHWPRRDENDTDWEQVNADTYRALEELYHEKKIRGIGLSNFLPHHIDALLKTATVEPVVDQLELHPGYTQDYAVEYLREHDIQPQAWSPLGRKELLTQKTIVEMAAKYQVCTAQICLRFLYQKHIISLPKSSSKERMEQNQDIFSFEISEADMHRLNTMPPTCFLGEHPDLAIPKKQSSSVIANC